MNNTNNLVYIYKVISPQEKVYIGISYNPKHRLVQHKGDKNSALFPVIKKYGLDNIKHSIICVAFGRDNAEELEIELIKYYDSYKNGYNRTRGGDGCGMPKALNEKQVLDIVDHLNEEKLSLREIGKLFNVSEKNIRHINEGKIWYYLTNRSEKTYRTNFKSKGETKYNTELTTDIVTEIKKLIVKGVPNAEIARIYNQKSGTIDQIKSGRNWSHIFVEGFDKVKINKNNSNKLDINNAREIRKLRFNGTKIGEIAKLYNVSRQSISKIINNKTFVE